MLVSTSYLASVKTNRCGVIPYTLLNDELYFLLSRHLYSNELGDFGGGVKKTEVSLVAGAREFFEESRGIFTGVYSNVDSMMDTFSIIDGNHMAIIFLPLDPKWIIQAQSKFKQIVPLKKSSLEVSELVWVSETQFSNLISPHWRSEQQNKLWTKIQLFFQRNKKHWSILQSLIKSSHKNMNRSFN